MSVRTHQWLGVINEYRSWIELPDGSPVITLGEGGTPLVQTNWLSNELNCDVHLKVEGNNPTGSFKDRGMTVAMSAAASEGVSAVVSASTGNTSASMAAYAVRANMTPVVLIPRGKIAAGKMAQAIMHGAKIIQVRGGFDECLDLARGLANEFPVALVNSVNPMRIIGQKTAAFEIVDALDRAPDLHVLPVGNAGNITAYWMGYTEYANAGFANDTPAMWGFQAAGAAPFVMGAPVEKPETVATAIRIGNPASWHQAIAARDESGGLIESVTDEQILEAQRLLAAHEGVFVEPASAAGVAGLLKKKRANELEPGQLIAVTVTGHGLKDIDTPLSALQLPDLTIDADLAQAAKAAGLS